MLVNTVGVFIGFLSLFLGGLALKENGLDMIIKRLFKEDEIPKNLVKIMNMVVTEAKPAAYLLILVGSLVFVISILGCCGVCCNKLKFMRIYVLLFSIIVVLLAVVIGFTAWQSTKAIKIMVAGGKFLLLNFHKRLNRDVFNGVQKYAKCCGVMQPGDYLESVKYQAYLHQKLLARKSNWDKINNGTDYRNVLIDIHFFWRFQTFIHDFCFCFYFSTIFINVFFTSNSTTAQIQFQTVVADPRQATAAFQTISQE